MRGVSNKHFNSGLSAELTPLFRPKRSRYVKSSKVSKNCIFCPATKEKASLKNLCVYQSEHSMVLLNKYPYNAGHLLILPTAHIASLSEFSAPEYQEFMLTLKLAASVIGKIYRPSGINIGLNQGAAAGAGIPDHLHFHLIPRWKGDLNFFPLISKAKIIIEETEETYKKVLAGFKKYTSSKN